MSRSVSIVGAQVFVLVNGNRIGRVMNFQYSVSSPKREIRGLDSHEPFELAPTTTSITGNISMVRTLGDGSVEGVGISAVNSLIPSERYFSLELIDRLTSNTVFKATQCSCTGQAWSAPAQGILTGSVSFTAISWSNEVQVLGT